MIIIVIIVMIIHCMVSTVIKCHCVKQLTPGYRGIAMVKIFH